MNTLLADLRNLKGVIREAFLEGATPVECAVRLGEKGFYPVPNEQDMKDCSPLLEAIKQVLLDEFYEEQKVQRLFGYNRAIRIFSKSSFSMLGKWLRDDEKTARWLPKAELEILRQKFGFQFDNVA